MGHPKRILSFLLALAITFSFALYLNQTMAADPPVISVGNALAKAGDTGVIIPVTITNNPGLSDVSMGISYDSSLTLTGFNSTSQTMSVDSQSKPEYNNVLLNDPSPEGFKGTTLVELVFSVDDEAEFGEKAISIDYIDPSTPTASITIETTAGFINVTDPDAPVISLGNVVAEPGDTGVIIPVTITNNPGLSDVSMGISYDSSLTLTGFNSNSEMMSINSQSNPENKAIRLTDLSPEGFKGTTLVELVFSVDDDAELGMKVIELDEIDSSTPTSAVTIESTAGFIKVIDPNPPVISVGNTTAKAGDTGVIIPVTIANNPGLSDVSMGISYDSSLTLTGFNSTSQTMSVDNQSKPEYNNVLLNDPSPEGFKGTTLIELVFSVDDDAELGNKAISIDYIDPSTPTASIFIETKPGFIKVIDPDDPDDPEVPFTLHGETVVLDSELNNTEGNTGESAAKALKATVSFDKMKASLSLGDIDFGTTASVVELYKDEDFTDMLPSDKGLWIKCGDAASIAEYNKDITNDKDKIALTTAYIKFDGVFFAVTMEREILYGDVLGTGNTTPKLSDAIALLRIVANHDINIDILASKVSSYDSPGMPKLGDAIVVLRVVANHEITLGPK